jgi:uncharacterized protein YggE
MRALLLVFLALAPLALAAERAEPTRTIAVTGQGEVGAVPDRAALSFAVETTAARAGEAGAANAKRSTAIAAAVKALIGPDGTVTTTRYTIEPRYDTPRPGELREPRIIGYVARNRFEAMEMAVARAMPTPIGPGEGTVSATLQVTYEIE